MKVKYSIIPFIPVALAMIALKLMGLFMPDSNGLVFGLNKMNIAYIVIGLSLALFVLCIIINIFDRKTASVYQVKRNPIAGIFSILSGALIVGASFYMMVTNDTSNEYYVMIMVCALLSVPAGIAMVLMSKVHFTGTSTASAISYLYIFPALWGCSEIVYQFMNSTKISISVNDMTPIFCYVFITLFLFSNAMIVSKINGRNPVKANFIYGLPATALCLSYGAYSLCVGIDEKTFDNSIVLGAMFIMLGLYSLSFLIEMFTGVLTKDEVEIFDEDIDEDSYENSYLAHVDDNDIAFLKSETSTNIEEEIDKPVPVEGLDDFVIGYNEKDDEEPIPYFTKSESEKKVPFNGVLLNSDEDSLENENTKQQSEIDLLLEELDSKK